MTSRETADLRPPLVATAIAGGLLTVGAAFAGTSAGVSTALGSVLAVVNLWALGKIVLALTTPPESELAPKEANAVPDQGPKKNHGVAWGFLGLIKFTALAGILWFAVKSSSIHPLFLGLGIAALPLGITGATFLKQAKV